VILIAVGGTVSSGDINILLIKSRWEMLRVLSNNIDGGNGKKIVSILLYPCLFFVYVMMLL